jgi:hypothetical protein
MSWTVSYSYGSICEQLSFDNEDDAQSFFEMISDRINEFGEGGEYESEVTMQEDDDEPS